MALNLLKIERNPQLEGFTLVEWATVVYTLITSVLILILSDRMSNDALMLEQRAYIVVATFALLYLYRIFPCRGVELLRTVVQMSFLTYWYPDTYEFNKLFLNRDYWFAEADQWLFGCQPSLVFHQLLSGPVWSELFNMGYFCYYFMIAAVAFFYFFFRHRSFEKASFVIIASFFVYYLAFIFLPVAGPQYYFHAIGVDNASNAVFPEIGHYFLNHTEMLKTPGYSDGFFYHLVESSQEAGERPTAAFPSSHVGMSTISMLLAWKTRNRWLFFIMLPIYVFLCGATVYIQAHYLIDALCGFVSSIGMYALMAWLYDNLKIPYRYERKRTF